MFTMISFILFNISCSLLSDSAITAMSSAYKWILILISLMYIPNFNPFTLSIRSFINMENYVGKRASPCLTPQLVLNHSVKTLLTLTQALLLI